MSSDNAESCEISRSRHENNESPAGSPKPKMARTTSPDNVIRAQENILTKGTSTVEEKDLAQDPPKFAATDDTGWEAPKSDSGDVVLIEEVSTPRDDNLKEDHESDDDIIFVKMVQKNLECDSEDEESELSTEEEEDMGPHSDPLVEAFIQSYNGLIFAVENEDCLSTEALSEQLALFQEVKSQVGGEEKANEIISLNKHRIMALLPQYAGSVGNIGQCEELEAEDQSSLHNNKLEPPKQDNEEMGMSQPNLESVHKQIVKEAVQELIANIKIEKSNMSEDQESEKNTEVEADSTRSGNCSEHDKKENNIDEVFIEDKEPEASQKPAKNSNEDEISSFHGTKSSANSEDSSLIDAADNVANVSDAITLHASIATPGVSVNEVFESVQSMDENDAADDTGGDYSTTEGK